MENRIIKFRAWDKVNKRFARIPTYMSDEGLLYADRDPNGVEMSGARKIGVMRHQYEFAGMFTGLKDKNGKEIYEGDIVSDGFEKAVVLWFKDECQFLAFNEHELSGFNDPQVLGDWAEVIGNIYENPELIKVLAPLPIKTP